MQSDNKRVAKNAVALALRMALVSFVGLFTSRIVLQALGVDDYGIYGVIGGIVGMASFLNTSMAGATSRFITYELGTGNKENLSKIFSTALIIHLCIALTVAILAETVGLWFVNNKMNFPPDRMFAVNVLYQFTIISMMVSFTQVPYSALIFAHEKMTIYAYVEIVNVVLKLLIVYLLLIVSTDRLILYAAMILGISVLTAVYYRFYCKKHFEEAEFHMTIDRPFLKKMIKFSGFDLYGNMCVVAKTQGQPIVMNLFFGVVANAGSAIALTVNGVLKGFINSVTQAFSPRIVKLYASGDISQMTRVMIQNIQLSLFVFAIIAIPFIIETRVILELWLGQIPPYAETFLQLVILATFCDIFIRVSNTGIHATGNIKRISLISGNLYLLSPIVSWIILRFLFKNANVLYCVDIAALFIVVILGIVFLSIQIPTIRARQYVRKIILAVLPVFISFFTTKELVSVLFDDPHGKGILAAICHLLVVTLLNLVILGVLTALISLNGQERKSVASIVTNRLAILTHR